MEEKSYFEEMAKKYIEKDFFGKWDVRYYADNCNDSRSIARRMYEKNISKVPDGMSFNDFFAVSEDIAAKVFEELEAEREEEQNND